MKMEKHKCKLCSRSFSSGRALGGHMRSHLATFPLPRPKTPPPTTVAATESTTSGECCSEEVFSTNGDQKVLMASYGLRKNPKKSLRSAEDGCGGGVQDGESETESAREPTGRRSKRSRRRAAAAPPCSTDQSVLSSVSDCSTEEDLAMCLMMLSRDVWKNKKKKMKVKISRKEEEKQENINGGDYEEIARNVADKKVHECPFCGKVFGSGQALGGHKRSHFTAATTTAATTTTTTVTASKMFFIDLNLPPPTEEVEEEEDRVVQVMQEVCAVS